MRKFDMLTLTPCTSKTRYLLSPLIVTFVLPLRVTSSVIAGSGLVSTRLQELSLQKVLERMMLIVSTVGNTEPAAQVPTAEFVFAAVIACRNVHVLASPGSARLFTT